MPPKKTLTKTYKSYTHKEHTYKAGDDVHVLIDDGDGPKISIAVINEFKIPTKVIDAAVRAASGSGSGSGRGSSSSTAASTAATAAASTSAAAAVAANPSDARGVDAGSVRVSLTWYYRPEEVRGGRKQFHGEREVFRSSHQDDVPASSLDGPAKVYSLASYQSLDRVRAGDYFWRFTYLPATEEFRPEKVPIYCVCSMPYNPDTFMMMCGRCEEWYHPRCVGLARDGGVTAALASKEYVCPQCEAAAAAS